MDGRNMSYAMAASTTIYAGSICAINSDGYVVPAAALAGNKGCPGIAIEKKVSTTAGVTYVTLQKGVFSLAISTGIQANVGETAYAADDQTVSVTDTGNLPICGKIVGLISSTRVWVDMIGADITY
jgi:hypothetical protein